MRHLAYNNEQPLKIELQGVKMALRGDREETINSIRFQFTIFNTALC